MTLPYTFIYSYTFVCFVRLHFPTTLTSLSDHAYVTFRRKPHHTGSRADRSRNGTDPILRSGPIPTNRDLSLTQHGCWIRGHVCEANEENHVVSRRPPPPSALRPPPSALRPPPSVLHTHQLYVEFGPNSPQFELELQPENLGLYARQVNGCQMRYKFDGGRLILDHFHSNYVRDAQLMSQVS